MVVGFRQQSLAVALREDSVVDEVDRYDDIDLVLHGQRGPVNGARVTYPALLRDLPDGVFIVREDEYWLLYHDGLHRWTPAGYAGRRDLFDGPAAVLTPRSTVDAIRLGYRPAVHRSADEIRIS